MSYENVIIEYRDRVGLITLNRPEQFNTFNTILAEELSRALSDLESDKRIRVVVIKGAGKAFCTGIDVSEFFGKSDMEYGKALAYSNDLFAALCVTEDAKEGVDAFLKKRTPEYKG